MNSKIEIYTERNYVTLTSRAVVYEWEDDFIKMFHTKFYSMPHPHKHPFAAFQRRINIFRPIPYQKNKPIKLFICMNTYLLKYICWVDNNVIPIILDPYEDELDDIYILTRKLPIYYMTCLELCKRMKERYPDSRVKYIPQCVSTRCCNYKSTTKNIDAIQFGRQDPLMHEFMLRYCTENPGTSYVYRVGNNVNGFSYQNTLGERMSFPESREEFLQLLSRAKICIVSTPLMDKSRNFGKNIDFFTARWYESPALSCHLVGRYSENEESVIIGIKDICANSTSYAMFKSECDKVLMNSFTQNPKWSEFLRNNNTYVRFKQIENDLKECI